jgi:glycosyltransferase involved in cell wall biosynthesis
MLKIAVYHNFHSGGGLRALYEMLKELKKNHIIDMYDLSCSDHKFQDIKSVVRQEFDYPFSPLPQIKKPFGRLNYLARYIDLFRIENKQKEIARDINQKNYDVAFIHHCQFTQAPAILRYLKNTPTLYFCHEPLRSAYEPAINRPYNKRSRTKKYLDQIDVFSALFKQKRKNIERSSARSASRIVGNSYFTRETIYRIYQQDARVVYLGVDPELFQPLKLPKDGGILSVGALTPLKGFDFVVRSLSMIPKNQRPSLTVVSNYQEEAEKNYLQNMAIDLDVDLHLLDKIGDARLVQLYNQAQITICSSVMEPFGLTPLESMACGTPVIAVAEGGLRESVTDGQTGFLVDRDPACCAEAICYLLSNPQLAATIGKNGRQHVLEHWIWSQTGKNIEKNLYECIEKERSAKSKR